jgi:hypothetical protein
MSTIQLLILFILLTFVHGTSKPSHEKPKLYELLKPMKQDHDNRYVWFTRNIHDELQNEPQNQEQVRKNNLNGFFHYKKWPVKVKKLFTT